MPIFVDGELVAFSANKAHWTEVGGKDPGSWTTDSTDVWQEGLQFPCVRLFAEGTPNEVLFDIIERQCPHAGHEPGRHVGSGRLLPAGALRFQDLCDKHGLPSVKEAIDILLDYGEAMVAQELAKLPAGVYEARTGSTTTASPRNRIYCQVKVTVSADKFVADFTGSAPQTPGPINCSWTGLVSAVRLIFKALTDPHIPANEGTFRAMEVVCPPGTVLTAERPAPVSTYWETMIFAADLVWKALAPTVPDRLSAGHFISVCGDVTFTIHPDTGKPAILVEPNAGGWGAAIDQDGEAGLVCVGDGETYILPLEVTEAIYGIQVDRYEFNTAPGGEGKYQGGRGLIRDYRILSEQGGFITAPSAGTNSCPGESTAAGTVRRTRSRSASPTAANRSPSARPPAIP